jgi:DNA-binding GntR family transcriptional regulator
MLTEPVLVAESVATDEERARLGLFAGEMVYRVDQVRGQGEHLLMESIRVAAALFPNLQTPVPSIRGLADTYDLQLGEALESISAVPAPANIAQALGVMEGVPLSMSDRLVYLRDGRPAEWRITYSLRD